MRSLLLVLVLAGSAFAQPKQPPAPITPTPVKPAPSGAQRCADLDKREAQLKLREQAVAKREADVKIREDAVAAHDAAERKRIEDENKKLRTKLK